MFLISRERKKLGRLRIKILKNNLKFIRNNKNVR